MAGKPNDVKPQRRSGHRLNLDYVKEFRDRHGKWHRYFRRAGQKLVRLPGDPGSPEFMTAYAEALNDQPQREHGKALRSHPGTISATIASYYTSHAWRGLSYGTQQMRRRILEQFRNEIGNFPIVKIERRHIVERLNHCSAGAVRNWLTAIRELMRYAVDMGLRVDDPTDGYKPGKAKARSDENDDEEDGWRTWPEELIAQYETHHAIGTKARLAEALLIFTAQRRSDIVRMGPQHIKNGRLTIKQQKTGTVVSIPIDPRLQHVLDNTPGIGDNLVFLVTNRKKGYVGSSFGAAFKTWCKEAGLSDDLSAHGLRKAWCRRAAEAGASEAQIQSVTGHKTSKEVQRYIKAANRELMSDQVINLVSKRRDK
jgi:integrase